MHPFMRMMEFIHEDNTGTINNMPDNDNNDSDPIFESPNEAATIFFFIAMAISGLAYIIMLVIGSSYTPLASNVSIASGLLFIASRIFMDINATGVGRTFRDWTGFDENWHIQNTTKLLMTLMVVILLGVTITALFT